MAVVMAAVAAVGDGYVGGGCDLVDLVEHHQDAAYASYHCHT